MSVGVCACVGGGSGDWRMFRGKKKEQRKGKRSEQFRSMSV